MSNVSRIDVIGSGFVGEATGRGFLGAGYSVTFIDIKPERVAELTAAGLTACVPQERSAQGPSADVSLLTVNTPTIAGKIQLKYLLAAVRQLADRLKQATNYHVVVVRSTVVPGTTEEIVAVLEKYSGKKVGRDFGVCMNPEYLREKTAVHDFANPWIVVIGQYDKRSGDTLAALYEKFTCPKYRVSLREAEMQKYVHNLYNAVKITFFNEMRQVARQTGVDPEHIFALTAQSAEGMWRPEYGTADRGPFDGSCLPKDTAAYLAWAAEQGIAMPLLATTIAVNTDLERTLAAEANTAVVEETMPESIETAVVAPALAA